MTKHSDTLQEAIKAHNAGDLKTAERLYKKILRANPLYFDALHLLGVCEFQKGNYSLSHQLIQRALAIKVNIPEAHFNLGNVLFSQNQLDKAVKSFKEAIKLNPDYVDAYNNLGTALRTLGIFDEAQNVYESALKIKPSALLWYNYGNVLSDQRKFLEAQIAFKNAIALEPNYTEAYDALGSAYANLKEFKSALIQYQKALALNPDFSNALSNISGALVETGNITDAITCAKRALAINPKSVPALENCGAALTMGGKFDEASCVLEQWHSLSSTSLKGNSAIARLAALQGDWCKAIYWHQKSYQLDPYHEGLEDGVYSAVLQYLLGDIQSAAATLKLTEQIAQSEDANQKNGKAYWLFIKTLLSTEPSNETSQTLNTLYVIGESHSLSYANSDISFNNANSRGTTIWTLGCKQWHIGNEESNQYKFALSGHLNRLQNSCDVLIVIGEIDCRPNEGIAKYLHSHPEAESDTIISKTILNYLNWLARTNAEKHHKLIISGVPAPNIDLDKLEIINKDNFIDLIARFNTVLKAESLKRGFRFLDVYSMTNDGTGISNGKWHIDEFHLTPAGGQEAFRNHLISP